jgi:hypothetical protein
MPMTEQSLHIYCILERKPSPPNRNFPHTIDYDPVGQR